MDRREEEEVIDLGIASVETLGGGKEVPEALIQQPRLNGISDD
jgi:hypothetical protein